MNLNFEFVYPIVVINFFLFFLWFVLPIKSFKKVFIFIIYFAILNGVYFVIANFWPLEYGAEFKFCYVISREGIIYLLFLILFCLNVFLKNQKIKKIDLFGLIYLLVGLVFLFLRGHPSFNVRLGGFKELYTFVILYFIGRYIFVSDENRFLKLGQMSVTLGVVLSFIVLIEFFTSIFLSEIILSKLGLGRYFHLMFSASERIYGSTGPLVDEISKFIPGNFRSEIGFRYAGISLDPASFAFYMTFFLIWSLVLNKNILSFIFITTIFLTFGKGGLLLALLVVIFYLWKTGRKLSLILFLFLFSIFVFIFFESLLKIIRTGSTIPHFLFFLEGLKLLFIVPFGYGLGYGGGISYMAGVGKGVGDTFFGSIISQVGILGLITFILFMINLVMYLLRKSNFINDKLLRRFCITLSFSIFMGFLISTVSGAPFLWNAMGIHMFFAGMLITMRTNSNNILQLKNRS